MRKRKLNKKNNLKLKRNYIADKKKNFYCFIFSNFIPEKIKVKTK